MPGFSPYPRWLLVAFGFVAGLAVSNAPPADSTKTPLPPSRQVRFYAVAYFSPETSAGLSVSAFRLVELGQGTRTANRSGTAIYTLNNPYPGKGFFRGLQATYNRCYDLSFSNDAVIAQANALGKNRATNRGMGDGHVNVYVNVAEAF
jgi:hypothetical protein